jgi:hypothetical protein
MAVLDLIPLPRKKKKAPKGWAAPAISVPRYTPPILPSQNPVPPRLVKKLKGIGRKYFFVNFTDRLSQGIAAAMMMLPVQMALDWLVDLTFFERFLILAADLGLLGYFVHRYLAPLILRPLDLEACALKVEKHWPRFRGRMIATVQFGKGRSSADSPELIAVLQQETDGRTATMNFGEIVPTKSMRRRFMAAVLLVAIFIGLFILTEPGSIALIKRVFLIPAAVPRKTGIICLSGNKIIPAGDSVTLEAQATGIIPSHGRVTLTDDTGKIREITMDPEKGQSDHFSLKVDRIESSLSYTITLNDATSDTYTVKTIPRPLVTAIDCEQVYPPYTGLPNAKRTVGNLALLAGSKLKIHATTNSKVVKAMIKLIGVDKTIPLAIGGPDETELTGQFDIPAADLTAFSIQITNVAGIVSGDETQYRVDLIPDRAPTIELTFPERLRELNTLKAHPTIAFVASDDFGLYKISLCYRIVQDTDTPAVDANGNPLPPPPPTKIEMDMPKDSHPLNMKNRYVLDFSTIKPPLTEGMTLEYWMEAEDGNNVTGPGVTDSEHHTIKIVSEIEKKADIMNRWVDELSTITEISQTQQNVNKDLGDIIQGKTDDKK